MLNIYTKDNNYFVGRCLKNREESFKRVKRIFVKRKFKRNFQAQIYETEELSLPGSEKHIPRDI